MKKRGMLVYDRVFAILFGAVGLVEAYGVVVKGAWWDIVWVAMAAVMVVALSRDAKKEVCNGDAPL